MSKVKLYKIINTILSIALGAFALYYIYTLFLDKVKIDNLLSSLMLLKKNLSVLIIVILLMPLNWFIEVIKWRLAIKSFQELSWKKSIISIGMGILLSLLTPNRMGELAGRLIFIRKGKKTKVFYSNLLCSMAQLQITILMGLIAILFFASEIEPWFKLSSELSITLIILSVFLSIYVYFSSNRLAKALAYLSRKIKRTDELEKFNISKLLRGKLLFYSFLRFIIFTLQFVILLRVFETGLAFIEAFMFVALLFFVMAVVPSTWLTDLPIRTSFSFFMFDQLGYNGVNAMVVTFIIWCINLILPSIMGFFALPKINWLSWYKTKRI